MAPSRTSLLDFDRCWRSEKWMTTCDRSVERRSRRFKVRRTRQMSLAFSAVRRRNARQEMTHGRHIKVLGRGSSSRMGDVNVVRTMLVDLIDVLGMRLLDKAHMYEVETE